MTGKYIDLAGKIARHTFCSLSSPRSEHQSEALRWLDEHPEAVPGRTITESRIAKAFGAEYVAWARMCLARIGITVVPDPEPTNAERLATQIRLISREFSPEGHDKSDEDRLAMELAVRLDRAGVKAPEGDES